MKYIWTLCVRRYYFNDGVAGVWEEVAHFATKELAMKYAEENIEICDEYYKIFESIVIESKEEF